MAKRLLGVMVAVALILGLGVGIARTAAAADGDYAVGSLVATPGDRQVSATWQSPAYGGEVSSYEVVVSPGPTVSVPAPATGVTVEGVEYGVTYTVSVLPIFTDATGAAAVSNPVRTEGGGGEGRQVGGGISVDTLWLASAGPYTVVSSLGVAPGASLLVGPGVQLVSATTVMFGGSGPIKIAGTAADPVTLDSGGNVLFGISSPQSLADMRIDHAVLTGGGTIMNAKPSYHDTGRPHFELTNSVVTNMAAGQFMFPQQDTIIEGSTFAGGSGFRFLSQPGSVVSFRNNRFRTAPASGYWVRFHEVSGGSVLLLGNSFEAPGTGVIGIELSAKFEPTYPRKNIDARNNFWGTTDRSVVDRMIYDDNDDRRASGLVAVDPILTEPGPTLPLAPPAPPRDVSASQAVGVGAATVTWTPPLSTGGSPVTAYEVVSTPGDVRVTVDGGTASVRVDGLQPRTYYTFTVRATNALGTSAPSPASDQVVTADVPAAPRFVVANPGDGEVAVSWEQAEPNWSWSPITEYRVVADPGGRGCVTDDPVRDSWPSTLSCVVEGLENGTAYRFSVTATNAAGTGAPGVSGDVTPAAAPDPPTAVAAGREDGSARVSWDAPNDNGAPVLRYDVVSSPGGAGCHSNGDTSCVVYGLENGTAYSFTVTATNTAGTSPLSTPSDAVTPAAVPTAPTNVTATAGDQAASVSWTAAEPNGAPVSGYIVTTSPAAQGCATSGATQCTVTGLINGTSYAFTVKATNAVGTSPDSGPTNPVTPSPADTTAPTVTAAGPPATVSSTTARFDLSGNDPGRPSAVLTYKCALDGAPATPCATPVAYTELAQGLHSFVVTVKDEAGNQSMPFSTSWRVDTVAPEITSDAGPRFTLASTVGLSYRGQDHNAGIASYDIRWRSASYKSGFGGFAYPDAPGQDWQATTQPSVSMSAAQGRTYCLSARTRDSAGNVSAWSPERCTATAVDDRSLKRSKGWTREKSKKDYAKSISSTTVKGAELTVYGVQARHLALVASTCPDCGKVGVYVDGKLIRKLDLSSKKPAHKQIVKIGDLGSVKRCTITIRTLSTKVVHIDGLLSSPV